MARVRIGSRPSRLAMAQAEIVKRRLEQLGSGLVCELVAIRTTGDKLTTASLADVGGKGLFIRELEQALDDCRIDIAVHSMKDLPAMLAPRYRLIAVPAREDSADVLLSPHRALDALPIGARLGTSSARRKFQALRLRPDLNILPLRGNIDTRIGRLRNGEFDAIILAAAGLVRLAPGGMPPLERLREEDFVPAGGQGALAIEARSGDSELERAAVSLDYFRTRAEVSAERAFLAAVGASCASPIGVKCTVEDATLRIRAMLFSRDGATSMADGLSLPAPRDVPEAEQAGIKLAERMLAGGAGNLIGHGTRG